MAASNPEYPIDQPGALDNVVFLDEWQKRHYDPYGQPDITPPEQVAPPEKVVVSLAAYAQLQWVSEQNLLPAQRLARRMNGDAQPIVDVLVPTALHDVFGQSLIEYVKTPGRIPFAVSSETREAIVTGNIRESRELVLPPKWMEVLVGLAGQPDGENPDFDVVAEHIALTTKPVSDETLLVREHGLRSRFKPLVTRGHLRSVETFPE